MRPATRLALLLALPLLPAAAQEWQAGLAYTALSTSFDWTDNAGAKSPFQPDGKSATAPSAFADVQAPFPLPWWNLVVTGDAGLRWALGSDVSDITYGLGIARRRRDGYVGVHYLFVSPTNGTKVLDQDLGIPTEGIQIIYRRGPLRADFERTVDNKRQTSFSGTDERTNTRLAAAVRYRRLGARVERWRDNNQFATGALTRTDLTRLSVFFAIGEYLGQRR